MKMTGNFSPCGLEQKISVKFVQIWYDCVELCDQIKILLICVLFCRLINFMTSMFVQLKQKHITLLIKVLVILIQGIMIKHLFIKGGGMIGLEFHILFAYLNKEVAQPCR